MPKSKQESLQGITKLVAKYQTLDERTTRTFSEADTRRVFIMPLFQALGWDVYSREEVAEEVKAAVGRVDYVFRLHGVSQFYLEAKALRADLTRPEYVKQAITYAYNKGITWAVLSDFEGLQIYNAQTGRLFINLSYDNYLRDFDDLWLLSKESFQTDALNERAEKYGALPPRLGIEQRLFNQLCHWREELFNQLHLHNEYLSVSQIDEVIQRLFNRLIFIRNCEDRQIEDRVLLSTVNEWRGGGHKGELIEKLRHIFRDFDGYYDSDLFAYHLTDTKEVIIESATIENILNGLYEIPGGMASYDFSIIDADVLGAVYEQYLGYVAAIVKQRAREAQARMDLGIPSETTFELTAKKQRRKEHGIYYTPKFVTNYIVKETVGRLLEERSYNEILNIKILDPACGSGSFLIRAYDELLNYHAYQRSKPVAELDQWERRAILLGNIFGVDLDMQAVEIARLNLLLRSLARRETLPSLADNIRRGNSLISGTEEELKNYFGDNWWEKNPFNWEEEFNGIMADGGFDVVIGNPPWVFTRDVDFGEPMKRYFSDRYVGASGKVNSYALFIWRGVSLLRPNGLFSMIIPNTFLRATTYEDLRRNLLENYSLLEITDAGPDVFPGVTASTAILIIKKDKKSRKVRVNSLSKAGKSELINSISTRTILKAPAAVISIYADKTFEQIANRLETYCEPLSTYIQYLISGIQTWKQHKSNFIADRQLSADYKPLLEGKDIGRYELHFAERYILYDRKVLNVMQDESIFLLKDKILIQRVSGGAQPIKATLDRDSFYTFNSINTLVCRGVDNRYILGCLNSKFINWFYYNKFTNRSSLTVNISARFLRNLPIRRIDFSNPAEKKIHDDLVALVSKMLELNKRLGPIRNTYCNERDELLREIERTDKEIDNLVYELYGLTEEERQIIENPV